MHEIKDYEQSCPDHSAIHHLLVELKIMMEVLFFPSLPQDHPQVEGAAGSWW